MMQNSFKVASLSISKVSLSVNTFPYSYLPFGFSIPIQFCDNLKLCFFITLWLHDYSLTALICFPRSNSASFLWLTFLVLCLLCVRRRRDYIISVCLLVNVFVCSPTHLQLVWNTKELLWECFLCGFSRRWTTQDAIGTPQRVWNWSEPWYFSVESTICYN